MNSSQVRAKARAAAARREDEIEEEEIMSGEINLVPYLDIVTNLMLFMLASISSGFVLGQIDTTLPDHSTSASKSPVKPDVNPDDQPLQLMVSITKNRMILWSATGLEGTLEEPKAQMALIPPEDSSAAPKYEYDKLNDALVEIATRRWSGKIRPTKTYDILLQADGDIPYETVITTMDYMRRVIPEGKEGKMLPPFQMPNFENRDGEDVPVEVYDPKKHALFVNVLFAKGGFD